MDQKSHQKEIAYIIQKEFKQEPRNIVRMSNGICNEVYQVRVDDREVFVRLHAEERYLLGSHNHIPIFKSKGIIVPDILAEDYSRQDIPYAYQVLSKLEGRDIHNVIHTLSDDQLRSIAKEISNVFRQLRDVPNNGKFGVLWGDENDLVDSWAADIEHMNEVVMNWGRRTGVLDDELRGILEWIGREYGPYFEQVKPVTYFGDICAKNVMVHKGKFSGLVDLDSLAQGDYLEAIGRIKASWYGTHYGQVYTEAVMDEEQLDTEKRKLVSMYALLNRTQWTFENGIQFNQNTKAEVNWEEHKKNKAVVRALFNELRATEG
jgi:aminoglycoside phosphotransferase